MPSIIIFSDFYSGGDEVADEVAQQLDHERVDSKVMNRATERFKVPHAKLIRAMQGPPSVFNRFTREKERNVACIQAVLAEFFQRDHVVYHGFAGHLVPRKITHVLRIGLATGRDHVIQEIMKGGGSEKEALRILKKEDQARKRWTQYLFNMEPWDESLYDIKLPMHTYSVEDAAAIICESVRKETHKRTGKSLQAVTDFLLAVDVNIALIEKGHYVKVSSEEGNITLLITQPVMRIKQLENELKEIAGTHPGVESVTIRIKRINEQSGKDTYEKHDLDLPSRILLVDDEMEFVQTLSERLKIRKLGSAVALSGAEALSVVNDDEPEVMVLDLRMPGIDGFSVLHQVKERHPDVEVIILTGHGKKKDEELAHEMGAFAFLEKPVNIDELDKTIRKAYRKPKDEKQSKQTGEH